MKQQIAMQINQSPDVTDLSIYFQMPEKVVAKELGICLTSLKKLCRQQGINRWPYRKVGNVPVPFSFVSYLFGRECMLNAISDPVPVFPLHRSRAWTGN